MKIDEFMPNGMQLDENANSVGEFLHRARSMMTAFYL
jgi:hypothetical protein